MCGICGYISKKHITEEKFHNINNLMTHRGPDDDGIYQCNLSDGLCVGMGHRRLSILDLSELGHQPMISADGNWVIVFNGEIYNFQEVRKQLEVKGHSFKSSCDTEVILHSYMEWGDDAVSRLDGMFAYAILNIEKQEMIFARDRIGKKPFYYYFDGESLIFASELKCIAAHPDFHKQINMAVLEKYLCYQYICQPDSIYENTFKLPAAHWMKVSLDGAIKNEIHSYWSLKDAYEAGKKNQLGSYEECKKELKNAVYSAVERRLVADVPVGTFLSGGIDSTLVTAVANDIKGGGVSTFTIGFDDESRNEAPFAKETAKLLGTDHHELYVTEKDMLGMVDGLTTYFDEPFADPSEIPTMLVSSLAKQNVTVALSGDGGDEFFCGYEMYDFVAWSQRLDGLAGFGNGILSAPGLKNIKKKLPATAVALLENRDKSYKTQLFIDLPEHFVSKMLIQPNTKVKYTLEESLKMPDWQERRMLLDMYTYLPENCLTKSDRSSMKYSLEMRCPLVDTQVMELSFRMPHEYKYHKGEKKYILKDLVYDYVSKEMMDRPKNGFGVPLGKWLRTYFKDEINRVSAEKFIKNQGIFDYDMVQELIEKVDKSDKKPYPKILWAYYIFQRWYLEVYIK